VTPEEARDRFSEAVDGELTAEERTQLQQALDSDPALRREFESFRSTVESTRSLRDSGVRPRRSLLPGAKLKLRQRSRGRLYRNGFADRGGPRFLPLLLVLVMLIVLGAAWFAFYLLDARSREPDHGVRPPLPAAPRSPDPSGPAAARQRFASGGHFPVAHGAAPGHAEPRVSEWRPPAW
jgi:anti-sigma factor RsiW